MTWKGTQACREQSYGLSAFLVEDAKLNGDLHRVAVWQIVDGLPKSLPETKHVHGLNPLGSLFRQLVSDRIEGLKFFSLHFQSPRFE